MEDSSLLQNKTLNPSEAVFSFPPHRRRPLRSRTYRTLIGILSHTNSSQLQIQAFMVLLDYGFALEDVDGDSQPRPVMIENGSISNIEVNLKLVSVLPPNSKHSKDTLVKETSIGVNKENVNFQDGVFDRNQATAPKVDHINLVIDGGQQVAQENSINSGDLLVVENKPGDFAIQVDKTHDNPMDGLGIFEELQVNNDFSVDDYSEVLDSCFGMDMVIESSKTSVQNKENDTVLEENIPKEAEHELQLKEMELEKLIYSSGAVDSSYCQNADVEIEEGEISGNAGVADASFDELYQDAASQEERTTEMVHASEDYFHREEVTCCDEDKEYRKHRMPDPSLINKVNNDCNSMEVERTVGEKQDCPSQNVHHDSHMETKKTGHIVPCLGKQSPSGRNLQENASENQMSATFEKDGDAKGKKRKNGPLTKERRAKKKKKDRIKRAEKNRNLGVKRLKLQPVLKPKTGEKCKFSHDTVPLTKLKPCGHFARHSCMKGDNCPYDHQLSKYPCKNYTTNGFCGRGNDCLFSHEMPAKQSPSTAPTASEPELTSVRHTVPSKVGSLSKVSKPEVNFSSPLNNSKSSKHMDSHGKFHQKLDAKFSSVGNSYGKSTDTPAAWSVPRSAGQTPKGISFLSNTGTSLGDTSEHEQDGSTKDVPIKPRGINFLSFARPTSDDSSNKTFSRFLSNSNNETRKSNVDDLDEGKPTCSLPESVGILKVNTQINQNATNLVRDLNEKVNGTVWTVPQQRNFSSFDPIINGRANLHFKKDDTAFLSVKESQSIPSKLQGLIRMSPLSFGRPPDQSTGCLTANSSMSFKRSFLSNTPSSVQKAVQSTLAFAANFEPDIKAGTSLHQLGS
ncbi:hypothetical protein OROHE_013026 [Orobanche hederae]